MEFVKSFFTGDDVTTFVLAIMALAIGVQKIHAMFAKDSAVVSGSRGEKEVIDVLREQVAELAKGNKELRLEIETLRQINNNLILENDAFRREIRELKEQIRILNERELPEPVRTFNIRVDS